MTEPKELLVHGLNKDGIIIDLAAYNRHLRAVKAGKTRRYRKGIESVTIIQRKGRWPQRVVTYRKELVFAPDVVPYHEQDKADLSTQYTNKED